jgi:menaquinone-dependent protoporphyrinogen oxidase
MIDFARRHASELQDMPSVFLSVSLSEAGAEDAAASEQHRLQAAADVEKMIQSFVEATGWQPTAAQAVAGALMYTRYNWLLRVVMKRIARQSGATTDASRDHEFTDWIALDRVVDDLITVVLPVSASTP